MIDLDDVLPNSGVVVGLTTLLPLLLLLPSCEEPPDPGKPVLQIHGTKPPNIDLALRLRYEATTEQRQCQKFTTRAGYEAITPAWYVWTHEPPSGETDERYRIVPMDTTGSLPDSLKGKDLEHFRWTINAGWIGDPSGCDFNLVGVSFFSFYHRAENKIINEIGNFNMKTNEDKCKPYYKRGQKNKKRLYVYCREKSSESGLEIYSRAKCSLSRGGSIARCVEKPTPDTIREFIDIRYISEAKTE